MHAHMQAAERPATSLVTLLLAGIYLFINSRGIGYAEVGSAREGHSIGSVLLAAA